MKQSIIISSDALESQSAEWNELLTQSPANTLFLTWEWMTSWLAASTSPVQLCVVTSRDECGRLVGILPLYRTKLRLVNTVPFSCLRMVGDYRSGSEYTDAITRPEDAQAIVDALVSHLASGPVAWDCLWIPRMAGWTGGCDRLVAACHRAGFHVRRRRATFSAFDLPPTMDEYMASLSSSTRSGLRRQARRVLDSPGVTISECTRAEDCRRYLDALYALHARRWQSVGQPGGFVRAGVTEFYERFVPVAVARGWARIYALECRHEIKAIQVGYAFNGVFHQLQEGFDPGYNDGAGNALRFKIIERCIAEGMVSYDFLGGFSEHKRRWGARERGGYDLFVGRRTLKNSILFRYGVWPTGRYLTERNPIDYTRSIGPFARAAGGTASPGSHA